MLQFPAPAESFQGDATITNHAADGASDVGSTQETSFRRTVFRAGSYCIFAFDLRQPVELLIERLCDTSSDGCGLDLALPTLFLAECVLVYMPSGQTMQLLRGLATHFSHAAFLHYEQASIQFVFHSTDHKLTSV